MFPEEEQNRIRLALSSVLAGVISQRLVPTLDNKRVAAIEVMVQTARIAELIAENRDFEIPDAIAEGKEIYGSQTFDQHLFELAIGGKISQDKALEFSSSPSDLKLRFEGIGRGGSSGDNASAPVDEDGEINLDAYDFKEDDE
jgi:twitching motility protein PilT